MNEKKAETKTETEKKEKSLRIKTGLKAGALVRTATVSAPADCCCVSNELA